MYKMFRATEWATAIGRNDLASRSREYLNLNCHLCAQHFERSMLNANQTRLLHHAMPTLAADHSLTTQNIATATADCNLTSTITVAARNLVSTSTAAAESKSKPAAVAYNWTAVTAADHNTASKITAVDHNSSSHEVFSFQSGTAGKQRGQLPYSRA